jgi:hypothetical protein
MLVLLALSTFIATDDSISRSPAKPRVRTAGI